MSDRVKFKIPAEVREKYTGSKCPKCNSPLFNFNGNIVCGGCQTKKLKLQAQQSIPTESNLKGYYEQKKEEKGRRKSTLAPGLVVEKTMGGQWPK